MANIMNLNIFLFDPYKVEFFKKIYGHLNFSF